MNTNQLLLISSLGLGVNLFGMFAMGGHHHHVSLVSAMEKPLSDSYRDTPIAMGIRTGITMGLSLPQQPIWEALVMVMSMSTCIMMIIRIHIHILIPVLQESTTKRTTATLILTY